MARKQNTTYLSRNIKLTLNNHLYSTSNVLVIGCGGAGLRAAIEVKKSGGESILNDGMKRLPYIFIPFLINLS